ncbi:hypothetical protein RCL1_005352 [Eukaryota sp. TZLM3-RCL]
MFFPNSLLVRCLSVLFVSSPYTDATARTSKAHLIRSIQLFNRFSLVSNNFRSVATDSFVIVLLADQCFIDVSSSRPMLCVHILSSNYESIHVPKSMIPSGWDGLNVKGPVHSLLALDVSSIRCLYIDLCEFNPTQLQSLIDHNNFDSLEELLLEGNFTQAIVDIFFSKSLSSLKKLTLMLEVIEDKQVVLPVLLSVTSLKILDLKGKSHTVYEWYSDRRSRKLSMNIENLINLVHISVDCYCIFNYFGIRKLTELKDLEFPKYVKFDGFLPEVVLSKFTMATPCKYLDSFKHNLSGSLVTMRNSADDNDKKILEHHPWLAPRIVSIIITTGLFPIYFMLLLSTLNVFLEKRSYCSDHLQLDLDLFPLLERLSVGFKELRLKICATRKTNLIKLLLDGTFFKMSDIETILEYSPYLTEVCLSQQRGGHYSHDLRQLDQCLSHVNIIELTRVWIHYNCFPHVRKFVAKKLELSLDGFNVVFPQVYEMKLTLVKISGSCALTVLREINLIDCHFRDPKLFLSFPRLRVLNASFDKRTKYQQSVGVPLPELSSSLEFPPLIESIRYTGPLPFIRNLMLQFRIQKDANLYMIHIDHGRVKVDWNKFT